MHVLVFVVARKRYGTSKQTMPQNLKQNTKNDTGHPNVGMHGPGQVFFTLTHVMLRPWTAQCVDGWSLKLIETHHCGVAFDFGA